MKIHPQALFFDASSRLSKLCDIVVPPFLHHGDENIEHRVCHVEQMSSEDTASWVRTLCQRKGWDEAATYYENFKQQEITGPLLRYLDRDDLVKSLMINPSHSADLMSAIRSLFPEPPVSDSLSVSELQASSSAPVSVCGALYPLPLMPFSSGSSLYDYHNSLRTVVNQSFYARSVLSNPASWSSVGGLSECGTSVQNIIYQSDIVSQSNCSERSDSAHWNKSANLNQLALTLTPDQIPGNGAKEIIRSWFLEFDNAVTVKPMGNKGDKYRIVFQDANAAHEAFLKFRERRFKIEKIHPHPPRAAPTNPVLYKALKTLTVQKGKSFKNPIVGYLEMGDTVFVNQIKRSRARLIKRKEDTENWGWVSLYSAGIPLLKRVGDLGDGQMMLNQANN